MFQSFDECTDLGLALYFLVPHYVNDLELGNSLTYLHRGVIRSPTSCSWSGRRRHREPSVVLPLIRYDVSRDRAPNQIWLLRTDYPCRAVEGSYTPTFESHLESSPLQIGGSRRVLQHPFQSPVLSCAAQAHNLARKLTSPRDKDVL